jgi:short-subunit dehydrogenase
LVVFAAKTFLFSAIKSTHMNNYTLITGASKGIGKAIAKEAASRGRNLLLVARSLDLLEQLASDMRKQYNIKVEVLSANLFKPDSPDLIFQFANEKGLNVDMLINNAGMGYCGHFDETDLALQLRIIQLNVDSCVRMAHVFLSKTDSSQRRYILNVSSVAAYQPIPYMTIYAASKSFIQSFSRGLRHELKPKNVYVTALSPGGTETEFFKDAQMEDIVKKNAQFMMSADEVAKVGFDALLKNKSVVVPGWMNKVGAVVSKLVPHNIVVPVAAKIYQK